VDAPDKYSKGLADRIKTFMAQTSVAVEKEGKRKDIRPAIESIVIVPSADGTVLEVTLQDRDNVKARIQDVIEKLFEIGPDESALVRIRRTAVFCSVEGRWASPMDTA
jgi:hypothetical protein